MNQKNPFYRRLYLSPDKHLVKYIFGQIIFRIIRINVYQNSNFWFSHFSEFEPNNFKQFKISDGLKNGSENNYRRNQNFSNCKVFAIWKMKEYGYSNVGDNVMLVTFWWKQF